MTARPIWVMFVSSVWIFIGLCGYEMVVHVLDAAMIVGAYPAGYNIKVLIAPFFLTGMELLLWFGLFRHARRPALVFAAVVGTYILLMIVLVNWIVADLYNRDVNGVVLLIYGYAGLGHLVYAVLGRADGH